MVAALKDIFFRLVLILMWGLFPFFVLGANSFSLTARQKVKLPEYIRVGLGKEVKSATIKVKGEFKLIDVFTLRVLDEGRNLSTVVAGAQGGIWCARFYNSQRIRIIPKQDGAILVNGRRFRGELEIILKEDRNFFLVNVLPLEDYIKGVLYHEVSHYWPKEVLKAQAIVCRTYVSYQAQVNKDRDFDVTADVYSQVYGGASSERFRTNRFVEETRGMVLLYQDELFPAYFHACCGGHTEAASSLWKIDILPLRGRYCPFCREAPHFHWQTLLPLEDIAKKLKIKEKILDIRTQGKTSSGRVKELILILDRGRHIIPAKEFRLKVGPEIIRSNRFKVKLMDSYVLFEGQGWGHGVGFCQWGAYFMAKHKADFVEILKYYYPGAHIVRMEDENRGF